MQTRIQVAGTCRSWRAVAKDTMFSSLWRCHGRLHHPLQLFGLVGPPLLTIWASELHCTACVLALHAENGTDMVFADQLVHLSLLSDTDTSTAHVLERPSSDA